MKVYMVEEGRSGRLIYKITVLGRRKTSHHAGWGFSKANGGAEPFFPEYASRVGESPGNCCGTPRPSLLTIE